MELINRHIPYCIRLSLSQLHAELFTLVRASLSLPPSQEVPTRISMDLLPPHRRLVEYALSLLEQLLDCLTGLGVRSIGNDR